MMVEIRHLLGLFPIGKSQEGPLPGMGRQCFARVRLTVRPSIGSPSTFPTNKAILGQPYEGFLSLVSTTSFINSLEGPLGPGFDLVFFENNRGYFLSTKALWKFSKVDSAPAIADCPIRFGVITKVQIPMISLSVVVRGGHFFLSLFRTNSCCLRSKTSATKP